LTTQMRMGLGLNAAAGVEPMNVGPSLGHPCGRQGLNQIVAIGVAAR
jgi:hypothetical protein